MDLLDENGASAVMMGVVNEIGPFDGSQAITVDEDGLYLRRPGSRSPAFS